MLKFFRENKLTAAIFLISLLVVLVGVVLVVISNKRAAQQAEAQQQLQTLSAIAAEAEKQLQQTVVHPEVPITDVIPQDSLDKVAAMENKNPEPGTADWCEVMMVKASKDWTTDEQQLFAKHCI